MMVAVTVTSHYVLTGVLVKPHYVVTAIVLNIGLLLLLGRWLWRQYRAALPWQRLVLPLALVARLLVARLSGIWPSPDVVGFSSYSWAMTRQFWSFPMDWAHTMVSNEFLFADWHVVYHGFSNTFFFHKLLSVVNLFSLGIDALTAAYLSLFCFITSWVLVRTFGRIWPRSAPGATVAFLLWPTVAFWTSTYTKESVLLGSGAWLLALAINALYGPPTASPWSRLGRAAGIVLLAALHFNMRFFYAMPFLGGLAALGLVRLLEHLRLVRSRAGQVVVVVGLLAGIAWLAPQLSPTFRLNKFTSQMVKVYSHHLSTSQDRPHFEYPDLVPTEESALRHLPLAVVNVFARPLPGQSRLPLYVAASVENVLIICLFVLALVAFWRGRSAGSLPFALVLVLAIYCLAVAMLLGLTTPNLGTLNRYRSAMLPFLLLLLLQNDYAVRLLGRLGLGAAPKALASN